MQYDTDSLQRIKNILTGKKQTIAVAESVTGGHLQAALSSVEDASLFYEGGISVYNIKQKVRHLNVDPLNAIQTNCVSAQVAEEMAVNVCRLFHCDWGLSITGYARPLEQEPQMELYAWYGVAKHGVITHVDRIIAEPDELLQVQLFYANTLLLNCYNCFL